MKINNLLYMTDDIIYLKNRKKSNIIRYKISKNIIRNGRIYNISRFIKEYNKLLNDNHLNNNLFGDTIKIIINPLYNPADIAFLKQIMEKFNYRKIVFENETKRYKLNMQNAYLNTYDNYLFLSYIDEYKKIKSYFIPSNFFENIQELLKYIKIKIKNRELYLIGKGESIKDIFTLFEKEYQNKTYIYKNHELYLLESVHSM